MEPHFSLTMGGGAVLARLPHDNQFDPLPELAGPANTVTGSKDTYLIPARLGMAYDRPWVNFELFYRKLFNSKFGWSSTGAWAGTGITHYNADAIGGSFGVRLVGWPYFRIMAAFLGEYGSYKAKVESTETGTGTESLARFSAATSLLGVGLQPEIWLGDMWSAALFTGYVYGNPSKWKAAYDSAAFGNTYSKGSTLVNPADGQAIRSAFGGWTVELVLRLNF